ncbi:protein of unknown function [Pararobbsia alpina]
MTRLPGFMPFIGVQLDMRRGPGSDPVRSNPVDLTGQPLQDGLARRVVTVQRLDYSPNRKLAHYSGVLCPQYRGIYPLANLYLRMRR